MVFKYRARDGSTSDFFDEIFKQRHIDLLLITNKSAN